MKEFASSGHYDSMPADRRDVRRAPGANDDVKPPRSSKWLARMSKRKIDATIIFMTVAGEEQGLLGAAYFAEQANRRK